MVVFPYAQFIDQMTYSEFAAFQGMSKWLVFKGWQVNVCYVYLTNSSFWVFIQVSRMAIAATSINARDNWMLIHFYLAHLPFCKFYNRIQHKCCLSQWRHSVSLIFHEYSSVFFVVVLFCFRYKVNGDNNCKYANWHN